MGKPLLDPVMLMETINVEATMETGTRLQTGALISVIDGFDRQILRDNFLPLTNHAMMLHTACGKLAMLGSIMNLFKAGELDDAKFEAAVTALMAIAKAEKDAVSKIMAQVVQCHGPDDPVH